MVSVLRASAIFTPGVFPSYTYVEREDEARLRVALGTPGMLVSLSGPTKTGKTVLVNQVVGRDDLVSVSGSAINSPEDIWRLAAQDQGLHNFPVEEVGDQLIGDVRTLLLDDFHYVARPVQSRIAQALKNWIARGLRCVIASVPHRADDPIRANPDLRGRIRALDMDYWDSSELEQIAIKGFPHLNVDLHEVGRQRLATQSLRQPQLMQLMCLETCRYFDIDVPVEPRRSLNVDSGDVAAVSTAVAEYTTSESAYQILKEGPATRGTLRTRYDFDGGGEGDVYEIVLKALSLDPPLLSMPMSELKSRVAQVLGTGSGGLQGRVQNTVKYMDKLMRERMPLERVLEWDEERHTIDILDPHFVFYLRWGIN